jgi:hypothetical protein
VLAFACALATPDSSGAEELCFTNWASHLPCYPDDIAFLLSYTGFSTEASPCVGQAPEDIYRATLSTSPTDPYVNSGPLPPDGKIYLWNAPLYLASASAGYGWGAFSLGLEGDLTIEAYEPIASGTHSWDDSTRQLWFETCEDASPTVIGAFHVSAPTSIELHSWGRVKSLYR